MLNAKEAAESGLISEAEQPGFDELARCGGVDPSSPSYGAASPLSPGLPPSPGHPHSQGFGGTRRDGKKFRFMMAALQGGLAAVAVTEHP